MGHNFTENENKFHPGAAVFPASGAIVKGDYHGQTDHGKSHRSLAGG